MSLKQPKCACIRPDARDCYCARYRLDNDSEDDGECECSCHDFDEDGENEWGVKEPNYDY